MHGYSSTYTYVGFFSFISNTLINLPDSGALLWGGTALQPHSQLSREAGEGRERQGLRGLGIFGVWGVSGLPKKAHDARPEGGRASVSECCQSPLKLPKTYTPLSH